MARLLVSIACFSVACGGGGADTMPPVPAGDAAPSDASDAPAAATSIDEAIRRLEAFVALHPDDATYTPDALFRLAELLYQRARAAHEQAFAAWEASPEGEPPRPDYTHAIARYEEILSRFADYDRSVETRYLLGHTLAEMDRRDDARRTWLAAACPNGVDAAAADPYGVCAPIDGSSSFLAEIWFRLGDLHFDDVGMPNTAEQAASAYQRALGDPQHRVYPFALFKLAWTHYRAERYADGLARFLEVLAWYEQPHQVAPPADLRPEALTYAAIVLTEEDWNGNGVDDASERLPGVVQRVHSMIPVDASWGFDLALQTADTLADQARGVDAIAVFTHVRTAWPAAAAQAGVDARIENVRRVLLLP